MRALKVNNLFWSFTSNKCKKIQPKTRVFVYSHHPKTESFGILYYWVYIKKFNDYWWITSVPAMSLHKWRISLNREFLLICV